MARALTLAALVLAAGCFHASSYSAGSSQAQWRAMRGNTSTGATRVSAPEAGSVLTAEQTYALALQNNPDVAVLAAQADVAAAGVGAAKQIDNPQLRFTGFNVDDAIASRATMNVGLRVPIPRPGSVRAETEGAKQLAAGRQALTDDAKRRLRAEVYKRYAQLAMLEADLEQCTRATELLAQRREQVAARAALSAATQLDVAMADVMYAEAKQAQADARDRLDEVEGQLARIAGTDTTVRFEVDRAQLRLVDLGLDRDALTDRAMAKRPELRTAHANVQAARAQTHVARSMAWPWFDWAQVQYRIERNPQPAAFGFGVALTLPVFSWNRGEVRASRALVRQRELEQRASIALVAGEVDEAVARVERTATRVRELEGELLPQVESAVHEAEAAIASGALDPLIANEIDARAVEARRMHLAALLAHREAVIELEAAVGEPVGAAPGEDRR